MGRPMGSGRYPIRYTNPITGVISSKSQYIDEHGVKRKIETQYQEYFYNSEWIKPGFVPHIRESVKKSQSTKRGFLLKILKTMNSKVRERKKQGKYLQGEYEFKDERYGRCDKFIAHFDKQVERYGNKCPMTHIPFTMDKTIRKYDINNYSNGIYSNISPDRIFNNIDYTEQNLIFTSQLWNLSKKTSSISELKFLFLPEVLERYKAIVMERFPDQEYVL